MSLHRLRPSLALIAGGLLLSTPVLADVIDGHWCQVDGRRFSIAGSSITIPGGTVTQGDYTRHSFSYRVPPGEPGAGQSILMYLRSETVLDLQVLDLHTGSPQAAPEVWRRCAATTSGSPGRIALPGPRRLAASLPTWGERAAMAHGGTPPACRTGANHA